MKVYDKNGTELRIGDTVHYYRPESTHEHDYGNGNMKTFIRPARDVKFTITEFVDSPFVKHGGHDPRLNENRLWITGPELQMTSRGRRNSVSPLAVVRIDTIVKKKVTPLSFVEVEPPVEDLSVRDALSSDVPNIYRSFLNFFGK